MVTFISQCSTIINGYIDQDSSFHHLTEICRREREGSHYIAITATVGILRLPPALLIKLIFYPEIKSQVGSFVSIESYYEPLVVLVGLCCN